MNILVDGRTIGSNPSGVGMYVYNFMVELMKDKQINFTLLSDVAESEEIKQLRVMGVEILLFGKKVNKNFGLYFYYRFIQKCIHQLKPDNFWEPNTLLPITIKNPYGKVMITVHDLFPITNPEYYGRVYEKYFKYGLFRGIELADIILYNSLETQEFTEKFYPQAKQKKHFISYIIINKLKASEIRDGNYFLYIGNLEKRKGSDLLLKAYQQYRQRGGMRPLYLGGKIREADIEEQIRQIENDQIGLKYLGYVEPEKKVQLYAHCSCFLFPSKAEGFGMPTVEVMNFNKPIIASNLSIFEEILGSSINYFDLASDEETQIRQLCDVMFEYQEPDLNLYKGIVDRFDAPQCGKHLKDFLLS